MNEEAMPTKKVARLVKEEAAHTKRTKLHVKEEGAHEHDEDWDVAEVDAEDGGGLHPADMEGMLAVFPEKAHEVLKNVKRERSVGPKAREV